MAPGPFSRPTKALSRLSARDDPSADGKSSSPAGVTVRQYNRFSAPVIPRITPRLASRGPFGETCGDDQGQDRVPRRHLRCPGSKSGDPSSFRICGRTTIPDLVIANGENAARGLGLSPDLYHKLRATGIDAITLGDHAFREAKIGQVLQTPDEPIARPANFAAGAIGRDHIRLQPSGSRTKSLFVITVLGRVFVGLPADDPFAAVDRLLARLPETDPLVIVEAHMEATSEKAALAHHLDGRVAAVLGTHTHVPTADARILPGGNRLHHRRRHVRTV